ncbi:ABC transporter substrate-binding protein [Oceanobacillus kimchii]|uniref:Spermidine/putrescine ABC transporter substrate-binding protein n=1 Tax=Oceanobacillus kimchii TaxID=746691 RepID=A0ABQ5TM04_9BACI|nr:MULTISPECIES: ABC transporter substrate-binding protein [Bacteria]MBT2599625.1 ABC transporter substrate-binding protein [Oceanobacillus sp. ISL-74]MCT1576815.1 ABC transporter substrate-binding protein [Oceanobacillus kimchii]MCT2134885.1 ABC transporter substrate-binding protein [Oceanobacillus kimchii]GLO67851.1 spermidine/putrescine ABC transporter substrate-binding protein [Oceanobacillus kimchii]
MKSIMRSFIAILVVSIVLLIMINRLNAAQGFSGDNTLTVYNWGDYIDEELISQFEEETGITIVYETFDSNEAMMTKIQQGGTTYDVAVPSEYMVQKMVEEDLLIELDHSKLSNLSNLDERFMNLPFDPNNQYSVPYFWGTVGIVFNTTLLPEGMKLTGWHDLWDPSLENQILLIDGAREIIGMGLNSLGYSLNDTNPDHLYQALERLEGLTPNVRAIVGDENKMLMANNEATIAVGWSGDAADIMGENEAIDYVVPEEGSNLWFDNFVIPKTAQNIDGAHEFINFMLDAEVAAQNTEYVSYSTPNKEALQFMPKEMVEDERFYPNPELTDRLEVYENLGQSNLAFYNELFLQFKMYRK